MGIEEERKLSNEVKEALGLTDRKCNAMAGELEESKALLDAAIRGQRQVEQELSDSREQMNDMQSANASLGNQKRKMENDIQQMQADLDNLLGNSKAAEEKAKKAMVDAGRLADELRAEQDHVSCTTMAICIHNRFQITRLVHRRELPGPLRCRCRRCRRRLRRPPSPWRVELLRSLQSWS